MIDSLLTPIVESTYLNSWIFLELYIIHWYFPL